MKSILCSIALCSLAGSTGLWADSLTVDQPISGMLEISDLIDAQGRYTDTHSLTLEEGQSIAITLESSAFDAHLSVRLPSGEVVEDDDSAGNYNSRVMLVGQGAGEVKITAAAFNAGATGAYTLTASVPQVNDLSAGDPHTFTMENGSMGFQLPVEADSTLQITTESSAFDTTLTVIGPDGTRLFNDDFGMVQNSWILYCPKESGVAHVTVGDFGGQGGEFTIQVKPIVAEEWLEPSPSAPAVYSGTLEPGGEAVSLGVRAAPGARLVIEGTSEEFLTELIAVAEGMEPNPYELYARSPRRRVSVPASGIVHCKVRAQSEGEGGAYRVVVFDLGMAMVPDFTLPNLDGEDVSSAQFENQVRIVDVWATWCPPCVQEIPHFMEIADEYRDRGVSVIGVSTGEDAATVRAFTEPRDVNYTILLDQDGQFANEMGPLTPEGSIQGIPTTFVIDQEGKIVSVHVGYTEKDVFTEEIDRLLAATD